MPGTTSFDELTGDSRALELVKARFKVGEDALSEVHSDYNEWERMYRNERVRSNYEGLSELVVPKAFEKVERGTALLTQAFKKVRVIPQSLNDRESAEANEQLIEYEDRVLNIPRLRKQWVKSARIYGQSYMKVTWNVGKEEPERPYKGIDMSIPDPRSVFYNPDHTPDKPFRWVVHEMEIPYNELKKNKKFKKDKLEIAKETGTLGGEQMIDQKRQLHPLHDTRDETTLMVNVKEYYGPFDKNSDGKEEDYIIWVANDNVVLHMEKSIYSDILDNPIPIIPLYIYILPHRGHAIGDIEAVAPLITELNDTRNQRMDTVTMNIDPPKEVLRSAQIDEEDLVAKKGWVIHSNVPNGYRTIPPDMQGVVASINEEKVIQGDIDRTLGIPSFGAETPVTGDITTDTATGVNATLQAQDIISNAVLEEVKSALGQVYRAILAYNQKFIDREFKVTVLEDNEQGFQELTFSPERIKGNVDLDIEVELVGNRLARRAEALAAIRIIGQFPGANIGQLIEDYLRTQDKYNIEEYWQPPQPPPPDPPKVSVSLRGEIGSIQANDIYKTIPGANQQFADPIFTEEGRNIIRGDLSEFEKADDKEFERGQAERRGQ